MEINITEPESSLYVQTEPKAVHPRAIMCICDGVEVGTVSATYDFTNLPPAFHAGVLETLQYSRVEYFYDAVRFAQRMAEREAAYQKKGFWARLLSLGD